PEGSGFCRRPTRASPAAEQRSPRNSGLSRRNSGLSGQNSGLSRRSSGLQPAETEGAKVWASALASAKPEGLAVEHLRSPQRTVRILLRLGHNPRANGILFDVPFAGVECISFCHSTIE